VQDFGDLAVIQLLILVHHDGHALAIGQGLNVFADGLQALAAQIQKAICKSGLFRIIHVAEYRQRQFGGLTQNLRVADIDLEALTQFHEAHGRLATVTAVRPPARFGGIVFEGDRVHSFAEKPQVGEGWVNGGFFVLQPGIADYIADDQILWEKEPMERLAEEGELFAYRHESFWHSMDTMRDVYDLERMWASGKPPWKVW